VLGNGHAPPCPRPCLPPARATLMSPRDQARLLARTMLAPSPSRYALSLPAVELPSRRGPCSPRPHHATPSLPAVELAYSRTPPASVAVAPTRARPGGSGAPCPGGCACLCPGSLCPHPRLLRRPCPSPTAAGLAQAVFSLQHTSFLPFTRTETGIGMRRK
jgi:hypothetical protein